MTEDMNAKYASDLAAAEWQRQSAVAAAMEKCFAEGIAIYGAGFLGTWANSYLQSLGVKVTKFIDQDSRKIGGTIDGLPIVGPTSRTIGIRPRGLRRRPTCNSRGGASAGAARFSHHVVRQATLSCEISLVCLPSGIACSSTSIR